MRRDSSVRKYLLRSAELEREWWEVEEKEGVRVWEGGGGLGVEGGGAGVARGRGVVPVVWVSGTRIMEPGRGSVEEVEDEGGEEVGGGGAGAAWVGKGIGPGGR